ncbi:MAG: YlxR family protein [Actinobacteria bacterium ATB1]|nr:YlxR family protein [Actinobacteria bacterium ATB1]
MGCGRTRSRADLVRLVAQADRVVLDPAKTTPGRGAWLCPSVVCFDLAGKRRAFERALRLVSGQSDASAGVAARLASLREVFCEMIGDETSGQGSGI